MKKVGGLKPSAYWKAPPLPVPVVCHVRITPNVECGDTAQAEQGQHHEWCPHYVRPTRDLTPYIRQEEL